VAPGVAMGVRPLTGSIPLAGPQGAGTSVQLAGWGPPAPPVSAPMIGPPMSSPMGAPMQWPGGGMPTLSSPVLGNAPILAAPGFYPAMPASVKTLGLPSIPQPQAQVQRLCRKGHSMIRISADLIQNRDGAIECDNCNKARIDQEDCLYQCNSCMEGYCQYCAENGFPTVAPPSQRQLDSWGRFPQRSIGAQPQAGPPGTSESMPLGSQPRMVGVYSTQPRPPAGGSIGSQPIVAGYPGSSTRVAPTAPRSCGKGHPLMRIEASMIQNPDGKIDCSQCGKKGIDQDNVLYHCPPCQDDFCDQCGDMALPEPEPGSVGLNPGNRGSQLTFPPPSKPASVAGSFVMPPLAPDPMQNPFEAAAPAPLTAEALAQLDPDGVFAGEPSDPSSEPEDMKVQIIKIAKQQIVIQRHRGLNSAEVQTLGAGNYIVLNGHEAQVSDGAGNWVSRVQVAQPVQGWVSFASLEDPPAPKKKDAIQEFARWNAVQWFQLRPDPFHSNILDAVRSYNRFTGEAAATMTQENQFAGPAQSNALMTAAE